jgi:MazG family protein
MTETAGAAFTRLVGIMRALRAPGGCPWDREQTLQSLRPFVLEETYELLETLDHGDMAGLREELGDYLYEAVFLAQIAEDAGHFSIADAVHGIADKLVRRHPHVFTPDGRPLAEAGADGMTADDVVRKWEDLKAAERQERGTPDTTILGGVPRALPALIRAYEMSARAAAVGFDWAKADDVLDKLDEEVREIREAVGRESPSPAHVEEELGDMLFAVCNLARKLGVEPEGALRKASDKFQARFTAMERLARDEGRPLPTLTLDEQDALWQRVKRATAHPDA